ncbi:hypothetical protein PSI23_21580 [Xenorhabdus sp. XENO-10]|uniref:Uncharacterized protein n=1 Tax=Xenorhabdus yunnanensis TaxID=3025878 RepID=A0ABT5LKZ9_9GAMM|nr:hypothetical protein [Xenorhabdus yunnanensis]MDC9591797.1 hypothetical protein [Xenorhabdus yunnanensis]
MTKTQSIDALPQTQKSDQWRSAVAEFTTEDLPCTQQTKTIFRQQLIKTAGVLKP